MKTNLRRIAAWVLTVMLVVGCLPVSAIGQDGEEYSVPVSVDNLISESEVKTQTLTFSWADEYDSYVYDRNTNQQAVKPYKLEVPVGSSVEACGLSMPPVEIRNHSENTEETKYLSIYNWRNTSLDNEQFTKSSTIYGDTAYTLELQLFAQEETTVNFNFICGLNGERHTVSFGSPTIKVGEALTQSQIPTEAALSDYCATEGNAEDYRFAGTWTIAKAGIQLTPDVVFSDENIASWKYENSDGVLIDIAADWEVLVAFSYTDEEGTQQSDEAWIRRGDSLGSVLPDGYVWTRAGGVIVTADTVADAPMTLTGVASAQQSVHTVFFLAGEHGYFEGDATVSLTVSAGETIGEALETIAVTPETGYAFTGWATEEGVEVTAQTVVTADMTAIAQYEQVQYTAVQRIENVDSSKLTEEMLAAFAAIRIGTPVSEISIPGFVPGEYVVYNDGTRSASPFDHWEWTDTSVQAVSLLDWMIPSAMAGSDTVTGQGVLTAVFESISDVEKLGAISDTRSTFEQITFSIPVYYYNATDGVTHKSSFSAKGPTTAPTRNNSQTTTTKFSANAGVEEAVGSGYEAVSVGIGESREKLNPAESTITFKVTATWDNRSSRYKTTLTSETSPSIAAGQAIYVQYAAAVPTATFNANGGSVTPTAVTGKEGDTFTFPSLEDRDGYRFKGWSTSADGDVEFYAGQSGTLTQGNVTYYAVWVQTHTITFSQNATGNKDGLSYSIVVEDGAPLSFPALPDGWQVEGATFSGWSQDYTGITPSGIDAVFAAGVQWMVSANEAALVTEDTTFYAIWVPETSSKSTSAYFHIRLDGTIPFEPSNYDSSGYTANHGMTGTIKAPVSVNNNLAGVAANIETAPSYAVILSKLHAAGAYTEVTTAAAFEANYRVVWYVIKKQCWDSKTGTYSDWHVDGIVVPIDSYLVTYHANGGTGVPDAHSQREGDAVTVRYSPIPTRVGYTFLGWAEDGEAVTPDYPYDGQTYTFIMPAQDVHLYAIWQANDDTPYTVEYYYSSSDGTYSDEPDETEERSGITGSTVSVTEKDKVPTKYGYVLDDGADGKKYQGIITAEGTLVLKVYFTYRVTDVTVNKSVGGNMGDAGKKFAFTATVKVNGEPVQPPEGEGYTVDKDGVISFELTGKAGSNTIRLTNIPTNAFVTVTEADYSSDGYTTSYCLGPNETTGREVELNVSQSQLEVTFRNIKNTSIDTGVALDIFPYLLLLGGALGVLAVAVLLRRRRER